MEGILKEWREKIKGVLEEIRGAKEVKEDLLEIRKEIRKGRKSKEDF